MSNFNLPPGVTLRDIEEQAGCSDDRVVSVVLRLVVMGKRPRAHEFSTIMTREELTKVQRAHAKDKLMINYIREDK